MPTSNTTPHGEIRDEVHVAWIEFGDSKKEALANALRTTELQTQKRGGKLSTTLYLSWGRGVFVLQCSCGGR